VAAVNQRDYIGIELNPKYIEMAKRRIGEAETGVSVKEPKAGQGALFT
jgi:DNA modification methylase